MTILNIAQDPSMTLQNAVAVLSALLAAGSLVITLIAIYIPWRDQQDQQLFEQATLALERSYDVLSNKGEDVSPPLNDRLRWLTSARNLLGYQSIKARLKTKLYKSLCEEHEEFWRHQFYVCLNMHKINDPSYFHGSIRDHRQPIEPNSALVIYSFSKWPVGRNDPIDSIDAQKLVFTSDPLAGNIGLREYLAKINHPSIKIPG